MLNIPGSVLKADLLNKPKERGKGKIGGKEYM